MYATCRYSTALVGEEIPTPKTTVVGVNSERLVHTMVKLCQQRRLHGLVATYATTQDIDDRLRILSWCAEEDRLPFLQQLAHIYKVEDEALLLARAVLATNHDDDDTQSVICANGNDDDYKWAFGGVEETKHSNDESVDQRMAAELGMLEEASATIWTCLAEERGVWKVVAELMLREAVVAHHCDHAPTINIPEEWLTRSQFTDLVVSAHEILHMNQAMLDTMTSFALAYKFSVKQPTRSLHKSSSIVNFDAHSASKRAAAVHAGKQIGEPSYSVASDWRNRLKVANGSYAPRLPPNPGGGPCLVGVDFDALDDLIGPP